MFGFDIFAEIMVVGALTLLAMVPLVFLKSETGGFLPCVVEKLKEGTIQFILASLLAYTVGVIANRLFDDAFDLAFNKIHYVFKVDLEPGAESEKDYANWAKNHSGVPEKLKNAEFLLRERNEATAAWLDRHKSNIRILRGASATSALLIITMSINIIYRRRNSRYRVIHLLITTTLLAASCTAYNFESLKYKNREYELMIEIQ
ncbi:MAG: hypothetical protein RJA36_841, partial [Pseudomonadota bacterium]